MAVPLGALRLVAADAAYRPFFLAFLSIGFAGGLWLPFGILLASVGDLARARAATGWLNAAAFIGLALGGPAAGRLVELYGYRRLFALGGGLNLLAGALLLIVLVAFARRRTPPAALAASPAAS